MGAAWEIEHDPLPTSKPGALREFEPTLGRFPKQRTASGLGAAGVVLMAGEWIPWVKGLTKRREVLHIANALSISRREAASCCMEIWEWCDDEGDFDESRNCHVNVTPMSQNCHGDVTALSCIDQVVGVPGFGVAMQEAGWVEQNDGTGIVFPSLGQYVGKSARERLSARIRKASERERGVECHKNVTKMSRKKRDKSVTPSCSCSYLLSVGVSIPVTLDTEAFKSAWDTWVQVRIEIKKPLTMTAAKLRLADCVKLGHDAAVAGLLNSAKHQWQDIFVPDEFKPKPEPHIPRIGTKEDAKTWVP